MLRKPAKYPSAGITKPIFPTTGSTITAATAPGLASNRLRNEFKSLKTAVSVSRAVDSVTPGLSGVPKVATPEPAAIKKESPCPW